MRAQPYEITDTFVSPIKRREEIMTSADDLEALQVAPKRHAAPPPDEPTTLLSLLYHDTRPVRHAEDHKIINETILIELERATEAANRADAECDDVRRAMKQIAAMIETAEHRKLTAEKALRDSEERLLSLKQELASDRAELEKIEEVAREKNDAIVAATAAMCSAMSPKAASGEDEISLLRENVDVEESRVIAMRQRHQDGYAQLKRLNLDVQGSRDTLARFEHKRTVLEDLRQQRTTLEAHTAFTDASGSYREFESLLSTVQQQLKDLTAARIERQGLILHLVEGANERGEAIAAARTQLARRAAARGKTSPDANLLDVIEKNKRLRADLVALLVNNSSEREAIEQLIAVLAERCSELTRRLRHAETIAQVAIN